METDNRLIRTDGPRLRHAPVFDGFRGIGVLIVVFYHAGPLMFLGGGTIVIDWFFVASGFLITAILLDERQATGTNSLRRFYERRILRLFPAMYAMLLAFAAAMGIATAVSSEARDTLGNWWVDVLGAALYSYHILAAAIPDQMTGAIGHTWSLSLEEQFYFIWPLILIFVLNKSRRSSDRNLMIGLGLFIATMIGLRMGLHHYVVADTRSAGVAVGTVDYKDLDDPSLAGFVYRLASVRPDMIAYGCLLAFVFKRLPSPLTPVLDRWISVIGKIGFAGFVIFLGAGNRLRELTLFGVGVFDLFGGPAYQLALLLLGPFILDLYVRPHGILSRAISTKPMMWIGIRSYGIYLWHVLPILIFFPAIENSWGVKRLAIGLVAGSVAVIPGILSFKFIERPFLHLKDTKFRRPQDISATDGITDDATTAQRERNP